MRGEGRAVRHESHLYQFLSIEVAGEQRVFELVTEMRAAVAGESGGGDLSPAADGRQAKPRFGDQWHAVDPLGQAAANPVDQGVVSPAEAIEDRAGG